MLGFNAYHLEAFLGVNFRLSQGWLPCLLHEAAYRFGCSLTERVTHYSLLCLLQELDTSGCHICNVFIRSWWCFCLLFGSDQILCDTRMVMMRTAVTRRSNSKGLAENAGSMPWACHQHPTTSPNKRLCYYRKDIDCQGIWMNLVNIKTSNKTKIPTIVGSERLWLVLKVTVQYF